MSMLGHSHALHAPPGPQLVQLDALPLSPQHRPPRQTPLVHSRLPRAQTPPSAFSLTHLDLERTWPAAHPVQPPSDPQRVQPGSSPVPEQHLPPPHTLLVHWWALGVVQGWPAAAGSPHDQQVLPSLILNVSFRCDEDWQEHDSLVHFPAAVEQ